MTLAKLKEGKFFDCFKLPKGISGDGRLLLITGREGVRF